MLPWLPQMEAESMDAGGNTAHVVTVADCGEEKK